MIKVISGSPQKIWVPIKPGATVYVGSIVSVDFSALDEGVVVREQADGVANTDNHDVPLGVVTGTNRRTPLWNSTYQAHYITAEAVTSLRTSTVEYVGVEGPWGKEARAMVQIELIDSCTILRAPFFDDAVGTALGVLTSTAGNANGLTVTTNACDFTPVANLATIYCRSGLNAGCYRQTDDTSTTVAAWDNEMPNTTATTGETYVRAPVRPIGISYVRIGDDTVASYINASETQATNYDIIHVIHLDLSTAGEEFCHFRFDGDHFCTVRA